MRVFIILSYIAATAFAGSFGGYQYQIPGSSYLQTNDFSNGIQQRNNFFNNGYSSTNGFSNGAFLSDQYQSGNNYRAPAASIGNGGAIRNQFSTAAGLSGVGSTFSSDFFNKNRFPGIPTAAPASSGFYNNGFYSNTKAPSVFNSNSVNAISRPISGNSFNGISTNFVKPIKNSFSNSGFTAANSFPSIPIHTNTFTTPKPFSFIETNKINNIPDKFPTRISAGDNGYKPTTTTPAPAIVENEFFSYEAPEKEFDIDNLDTTLSEKVKHKLRLIFVKELENKATEKKKSLELDQEVNKPSVADDREPQLNEFATTINDLNAQIDSFDESSNYNGDSSVGLNFASRTLVTGFGQETEYLPSDNDN